MNHYFCKSRLHYGILVFKWWKAKIVEKRWSTKRSGGVREEEGGSIPSISESDISSRKNRAPSIYQAVVAFRLENGPINRLNCLKTTASYYYVRLWAVAVVDNLHVPLRLPSIHPPAPHCPDHNVVRSAFTESCSNIEHISIFMMKIEPTLNVINVWITFISGLYLDEFHLPVEMKHKIENTATASLIDANIVKKVM